MGSKELALKLKALADKGIGGEKETAEALLKKYMAKHGITESDLGNNVIKDHFLTLTRHSFAVALAHQIVYMVCGNLNKSKGAYATSRNFLVCCTTSEFIEIEALYSFYMPHLERDLDMELLYRAFVQRQQLFPPQELIDKKTIKKDDEATVRKVLQIQQAMDRHDFHKQLKGN